jgi:predicted O-linked N-acetylglucosamine transferase (SPINDLY family)
LDSRVKSIVLALSPPDGSVERNEIERSASLSLQLWSLPDSEKIERIRDAKLHILLNLNGYTAGARNDLVYAGLAPVQV